ncbi:hypothetical protein [Flavobacterium sp. UBA7663]|uniref:hypothetical protein n=1 Tax=Flavobacterium sp. UBA7663 TaxID=1946557 RepID=UPI0025C0532C|nr:hypothetical protein [Flavobacterium sp. UBA7663]
MKSTFFYDDNHIWINYPTLINWKIEQRNLLDSIEKVDLISMINSSIIIELATFIEGMVFEMQTEIFYTRINSKTRFEVCVVEYFDKKLDGATWANYVDFFEIIFGQKLSSKITPDVWKSISLLFKFRNLLVHGNVIQIEYYTENAKTGAECSSKFKPIFEYLKEKKLLDLTFTPQTNTVDLLNNNAINHFYKYSLKFLEELFNHLPELALLKKNFEDSIKT